MLPNQRNQEVGARQIAPTSERAIAENYAQLQQT